MTSKKYNEIVVKSHYTVTVICLIFAIVVTLVAGCTNNQPPTPLSKAGTPVVIKYINMIGVVKRNTSYDMTVVYRNGLSQLEEITIPNNLVIELQVDVKPTIKQNVEPQLLKPVPDNHNDIACE